MLLILLLIICLVISQHSITGHIPVSYKKSYSWPQINTTEKWSFVNLHKTFNNQLTLIHTLPLVLAYQCELRFMIFITILYIFLKFFGTLYNSTVWSTSTVAFIMFINSGPIALIVGLESLALVMVSILIRFIKSNLNKNDQKKLLIVFILNTISFILLVFVLSHWSLFTQVYDSGMWNRSLKCAVVTYFLIKFSTLMSSVFKIFFYESIPLRVIATISLVQVILVPIMVFTTSYQLFSGFEAVCLFIFISCNIPFMNYLMDTKSLTHLVAYTTALTNGWAVLLFIL